MTIYGRHASVDQGSNGYLGEEQYDVGLHAPPRRLRISRPRLYPAMWTSNAWRYFPGGKGRAFACRQSARCERTFARSLRRDGASDVDRVCHSSGDDWRRFPRSRESRLRPYRPHYDASVHIRIVKNFGCGKDFSLFDRSTPAQGRHAGSGGDRIPELQPATMQKTDRHDASYRRAAANQSEYCLERFRFGGSAKNQGLARARPARGQNERLGEDL